MTKDPYFLCPCCSKKTYLNCCYLYHQGKEAPNPETLMRSRYSAYALNNVDYILRTAALNRNVPKEELLKFAMQTDFEKLEILDSKEEGNRGIVVFIAHLKQGGNDVTFTERSFFSKVDGKWLYVNGDVFPGANPEIRV